MYPAYVREKARSLRTDRNLSIDEIAERLSLPKTTVYYWVKDLPLGRARRANSGQRRGNRGMRARYRLAREAAYAAGREEFAELAMDATFRDFVCIYIGEGSKRNRNRVAIGNSDPAVVKLAHRWITLFARNPVRCSVQYHADQRLDELLAFWANELAIPPEAISLQRKSNSGGLKGRTWRSRYGVLTVTAGDTLLRARLQAWIDCVKESWV